MLPRPDVAHPELGFYTLAGAPETTRALIDEVREAEDLGLGYAFVSERYYKKEAAVQSGAVGAVSEKIAIATGVTNHNTRHPMVTAGYAHTMQSLTGGRFVLGLGRGITRMQDAFGLGRITTAQMEDFAGLMRRLFRGEAIIGHDGPAGKYPVLHLNAGLDEHLPMGISAFGPETLKLGGRAFDQVILHTFFTEETTRRCVDTVKQAAVDAGRDPDDVQVWSCFAVVSDEISEDVRLKKTVGRLATYLQGYGDLMVKTNGWDPAALDAFRADEFVSTFRGALDDVATPDQLAHVATLIPDEWLAPDGDRVIRSVRRGGEGPARDGLRRRDHARRQPEPAPLGDRGLLSGDSGEFGDRIRDDRLRLVDPAQTDERDTGVGVGDLHIGHIGELKSAHAGRHERDPLPCCHQTDDRRVLGCFDRRVVPDAVAAEQRTEFGVQRG
jgi:probable F420-dependent oxidoreductase